MFSIAPDLITANKVADYLEKHYLQNNEGFVHICPGRQSGCKTTWLKHKRKKNEFIQHQTSGRKSIFTGSTSRARERSRSVLSETLPHFDNVEELLALPLVERSKRILSAIIGDEISAEQLANMVAKAFTFPAPLAKVEDHIYALELFHGPTLAFKDFGGRFMAQALATVRKDGKITILTATSGDTGAAVAHAFMDWKILMSSFSIRKAKSACCKKNYSALWVEIFALSPLKEILMPAKHWLNKLLMIRHCVKRLA